MIKPMSMSTVVCLGLVALFDADVTYAQQTAKPACTRVREASADDKLCKEPLARLRCEIIKLVCDIEEAVGPGWLDVELEEGVSIDVSPEITPGVREKLETWIGSALKTLEAEARGVRDQQLDKLGCRITSTEGLTVCLDADGRRMDGGGETLKVTPGDLLRFVVVAPAKDQRQYRLEATASRSNDEPFRRASPASEAAVTATAQPVPNIAESAKAAVEKANAEDQKKKLENAKKVLETVKNDLAPSLNSVKGDIDDQIFSRFKGAAESAAGKLRSALAPVDGLFKARTPEALDQLARADRSGFAREAEAVEKAAAQDIEAAEKALERAKAVLREADMRERIASLHKKALIVTKAVELVVPINQDINLRKVVVRFTRSPAKTAAPERGDGPVTKLFELRVTRGRYYFDVGILVAFFPDARSHYRASASAIPGTDVRRVSLDDGVDPRGAIALNVYPFGRRRGEISSLHGCGAWGECFGETLGIQVGTNLNFDKIEREAFYLGFLFEPVSGFALNLGVAWVQTDQLKSGWADGTLLAPGDEVGKTTRLVPTPYFGFTISTEVFSTARQLAAGIE